MKRKLYLHIGVHRTATTSAQRFLKANFVPLQKKGYFNPDAAGRNFELFNRIFDGTTTAEEVGADIEMRADGKKYPIESIILSDEDICTRRDLSPLAEFSDRFDVTVVLMMRRQDLWIESWYQQNVKWQWNRALSHLPFPEFLARRADFFWIDYDRMVRTLEGLFGPDRVKCLVFERAEMPEGPVAAVCEAMGLVDLSGFKPAPWANTSLSPMMTEFMRNLPLDEIVPQERGLFEQACIEADREVRLWSERQMGKVAAAGAKVPALFMDFETRNNVLSEYVAGNAALAQRRFGRDRLFLDPLPDKDSPIAPQRLPADSYALMQDLVAPFIRALTVRMAADREAAVVKLAKTTATQTPGQQAAAQQATGQQVAGPASRS